jgi:hypothetical protein
MISGTLLRAAAAVVCAGKIHACTSRGLLGHNGAPAPALGVPLSTGTGGGALGTVGISIATSLRTIRHGIIGGQRARAVPLIHLRRLVTGAAIGGQRADGAVRELHVQNLEGLELLDGPSEPPLRLVPHLHLVSELLLQLVQLRPNQPSDQTFSRQRVQSGCEQIEIQEDETVRNVLRKVG